MSGPPQSLGATQKTKSPWSIAYGIFCLIGCCWFVVFLILGICGAVLYDRYSLVDTTSVMQIHRQTVPLIAIHDLSTKFIRLSEISRTDVVPISFYTLSDCFSDDSFIDVEVDEIVTVNFGSTDKTKAVTEFYLLRNTTLTLNITTDVIPTYATNHCIAFLLVFNNFDKFFNFILSSSLESDENYYYKGCIANEQSQTMNMAFNKPSYYYIGVYTDIPTEVATFSLHFLGTYLQYDISNKDAVCTIDSRDALSCEFSPENNQQTCIVGSVPPISTVTPFGVNVSSYAAANSDAAVDAYFFIPLMVTFVVLYIVTISILFYISPCA